MSTAQPARLLACGMYASTEPLRDAWTALLSPLCWIVAQTDDSFLTSALQLRFDTSSDIYQSPQLFLGHTCGYPYMTRWKQSHQLVCVPEFEISGCSGTQYSSWFICHSDDQRSSFESFSGAIAVINGANSNSGMNVLRYQASLHTTNGRFFSNFNTSGSHTESMRAVATGDADIAAIDAISYHHIVKSDPMLANAIKVMGQSVYTTGLPFITHNNEQMDRSVLIDALNQCVEQSSDTNRERLKLIRFSEVSEADYDALIRLETEAIAAGYPTLS